VGVARHKGAAVLQTKELKKRYGAIENRFRVRVRVRVMGAKASPRAGETKGGAEDGRSPGEALQARQQPREEQIVEHDAGDEPRRRVDGPTLRFRRDELKPNQRRPKALLFGSMFEFKRNRYQRGFK